VSDQTAGSSEVDGRVAAGSLRPILRRIVYVLLALEVACLMGLFGCDSCKHKATLPQGYSCINQACVASVAFFGGTPAGDAILGFQSSIFLPASSGLNGGTATTPSGQVAGGFLRNSIVINAGPSNNFVEAGYVAQGGVNLAECGQGGNFYFLTDFSTGNLVTRCLAPIPAQDFGNYINFRILNVGNSGSTPTFMVSINGPGTNLQPCTEATPCLEPLWIPGSGSFASAALGQTLVGTSGAFADSALFINTSYQNASGAGHLNPLTADGTAAFDNPPLGEWLTAPSQPSGANGGVYHTFCCQISTAFPGSLYFGNVPVHSTPGSQTATITNTSTSSSMSITGIAISGAKSSDFTKNSGCGSTLAPGATCSITVTFTPSAQGREDATLTVSDSGGSGSGSETVNLYGYGH
jgi:hypothetical protein